MKKNKIFTLLLIVFSKSIRVKKLLISESILLITALSVFAQSPDSIILGSWYQSKPSLIESTDTLFFSRKLSSNTFTLWNFKANNTLTISTGSIRKGNNQAKCFSGVLHYKWALIDTNNKFQKLEISISNDADTFRLTHLDSEKLVLKRIISD